MGVSKNHPQKTHRRKRGDRQGWSINLQGGIKEKKAELTGTNKCQRSGREQARGRGLWGSEASGSRWQVAHTLSLLPQIPWK